jgi:hypothetical protein
MLETEIRDLFRSQVASELPVARISIAEAHAAARLRLRLRRAGAAVSPLVAAAAVFAIVVSGSALTGAGRSPAGPRRQPAAPREFSVTRSHVRLTWLPGRSAVTQYTLSSASDGLEISSGAVWDFGAMAAGQCQLRHRKLSCPVIRGLPLRRVVGMVGGRPMYLSVLGINIGILSWEYAPGAWAQMTGRSAASGVLTALRIARGARFGPAVAAPARFPYRLTGLPAGWSFSGLSISPGRRDPIQSATFSPPAGSSLSPVVIANEPAGTMAACRRLIASPASGKYQLNYRTIASHQVLLSFGPSGPRYFRNHSLCAPDADGVLLELLGGPYSSLLPVFEHLRLLGANPKHWTTRPVG